MVDSISKTRITRSQAESIVAAVDGRTLSTFAECDEGWFNAVHRLGFDDGTDCILKIAPPADVPVLRYEHDLITTEVDALRLVGDRTEVPVPAVLAWDDSCELIPSPYFLMEACPGELLSTVRPGLDVDAARHVDGQLARLLASLHGITGPDFGRPDPTATRDVRWSVAFARLIGDLLADASDAAVVLPAPADAIELMVEQHASPLDEVTTPRLVHWDLWDPNVFVDPDTLDVVGVIDFERVLWADPLIEAQFFGRRADDAVVEAYGRPLFDPPGAAARRRLYDLYLYLVMTVECSYRNYPTDDIEQMARPGLAAIIQEIRDA